MDRAQTQALLATRSTLTAQPYGPDTVANWHAILQGADYAAARVAVIAAASTNSKVTVADVLAHIPPPQRELEPYPNRCDLCDNTGYVETPPHPGRPCLYRTARGECICHAVTPCRCTIGQTRKVPQ